jgi:adenosyl cobinamide kinase/adenosyl cobinamide phosphate guanylyltransferase
MSKLKGKAPTLTKKRLKAFFYGSSGTGKTSCCIQFPNAYYIDTEKGAEHQQYVDVLTKNNSVVYQTRDFEDLYDQVKALATEQHDFETIIIDPITSIYSNLLDACSKKFDNRFNKHYGELNKSFERLLDLLLRIDMNVIITSHSKKEYGKEMSVIGTTFDAYKKLDYIFDLVIETKIENKRYVGVIKKSRISSMPTGEEIDFNYKMLDGLYRKDLGKSVPLELISEESLAELQNLIARTPNSEEWIAKCLTSANVLELSALSQEQGSKMIAFLKSKQPTPLQVVK